MEGVAHSDKRQAMFTDSSARLAEENIFLPNVPRLFDPLSSGVVGNAPGFCLEVEARTTKFSEEGCWVRKLGSRGGAMAAGNCPIHRSPVMGICMLSNGFLSEK